MKRGHVAYRTCRGCGLRAPKHALVRHVIDDSGISADTLKQRAGRGMYCCPAGQCLERMLINGRRLKKSRNRAVMDSSRARQPQAGTDEVGSNA